MEYFSDSHLMNLNLNQKPFTNGLTSESTNHGEISL